MFYLIYVSSAVHLFSNDELAALLEKSRINNAQLSITGMLLYKGGNFMQALEGEEATVRALYAKIERDPRHRGSIIMFQGRAEERQFPDWSMGFRDLNREDAQNSTGYSEFLNTPLTDKQFTENPTRCQRLLLSFKQNM